MNQPLGKLNELHEHGKHPTLYKNGPKNIKPDVSQFIIDMSAATITCKYCGKKSKLPECKIHIANETREKINTFKDRHQKCIKKQTRKKT